MNYNYRLRILGVAICALLAIAALLIFTGWRDRSMPTRLDSAPMGVVD